ncbi:MAG: DUF1538 domain-containing protein [Rhodospirillales bacterium]|nr:DUF1538 domain-containing protein [Rhodospirillales bacterium]
MDLLDRTLVIAGATAVDVAPIVAVLLGFQVLVLRRPIANVRRIAVGCAAVVLGLTLFLVGLEEALFPIGRTMAQQLTAVSPMIAAGAANWSAYGWVYAFAAAVGFAAAIAEPALIAVSLKAEQVSAGTIPATGLRVAVAVGAGLGVAVGTLRIAAGLPMPMMIAAAYAIVALQTAVAPRAIVPIAYDVGGVTTSTVTVPVVTALGLGLASAIPGRSPLLDGFGLIAFTCLCPIMSVLAYATVAQSVRRRHSRGREETGEER